MTGSEVLLDSSVWLDYFLNASDKSVKYIDSRNYSLLSCGISLHEVKKKLLRDKYPAGKISMSLRLMRAKSLIVEVSSDIFEKSAEDSVNLKLHTADSIIYRAAMESNASLVTLDSHFKNLEGVILL